MTKDLEQKLNAYIERHPELSFTAMSTRLDVGRSTLAKVAKRNGIAIFASSISSGARPST
jgi:hypothetical protein